MILKVRNIYDLPSFPYLMWIIQVGYASVNLENRFVFSKFWIFMRVYNASIPIETNEASFRDLIGIRVSYL